jgi:hypothetical protein
MGFNSVFKGLNEDINDFLELQYANTQMVRSHLRVTPAVKNRMSKIFTPPVYRRKNKFLGAFAKLREVTIRFVCPSVCLSTRKNSLPLDEFLLNFIYEYISKICRKNLNLITI